jgi:hypothetical protein
LNIHQRIGVFHFICVFFFSHALLHADEPDYGQIETELLIQAELPDTTRLLLTQETMNDLLDHFITDTNFRLMLAASLLNANNIATDPNSSDDEIISAENTMKSIHRIDTSISDPPTKFNIRKTKFKFEKHFRFSEYKAIVTGKHIDGWFSVNKDMINASLIYRDDQPTIRVELNITGEFRVNFRTSHFIKIFGKWHRMNRSNFTLSIDHITGGFDLPLIPIIEGSQLYLGPVSHNDVSLGPITYSGDRVVSVYSDKMKTIVNNWFISYFDRDIVDELRVMFLLYIIPQLQSVGIAKVTPSVLTLTAIEYLLRSDDGIQIFPNYSDPEKTILELKYNAYVIRKSIYDPDECTLEFQWPSIFTYPQNVDHLLDNHPFLVNLPMNLISKLFYVVGKLGVICTDYVSLPQTSELQILQYKPSGTFSIVQNEDVLEDHKIHIVIPVNYSLWHLNPEFEGLNCEGVYACSGSLHIYYEIVRDEDSVYLKATQLELSNDISSVRLNLQFDETTGLENNALDLNLLAPIYPYLQKDFFFSENLGGVTDLNEIPASYDISRTTDHLFLGFRFPY